VYGVNAAVELRADGLPRHAQPFRPTASPGDPPAEREAADRGNATALHVRQLARFVRALSARRFSRLRRGGGGGEEEEEEEEAAVEQRELSDLLGYKVR
jgi:hypothetical protein